MSEPEPRRRCTRPGLALGFAIAALAASWNPLAAPFAFVVAVGAIVLSARALRAGGRRRLAGTALALSILALVASAAILLATAGGVGTELTGERVVKGRDAAEVDRALSEAAARTRAERERAARELSQPAKPGSTRPERHQ